MITPVIRHLCLKNDVRSILNSSTLSNPTTRLLSKATVCLMLDRFIDVNFFLLLTNESSLLNFLMTWAYNNAI